MADYIRQIDYWFFDLINQKGSFSFGDIFFSNITDLHQSIYFKIIVIPLFIFLFVKKYKRAGYTIFLFLILALSFSDFFGAQVKNHFLRPRPFENSEIMSTQKSPAGGKSFYSNHASNMFAFATFTVQFIPVLKIPTYILAATVSYSRVYNGVHYPSDVLAGGFIGTLWGYLFSFLTIKVLQRFHKDIFK
jgi:undecaprenyl-diphosphatase